MENIESKINEINKSETSVAPKGSEAILLEAKLDMQKKLVKYMAPEALLPYLAFDDESVDNNSTLDALMEQWIEKYANNFAEYWDKNAENIDFLERITQETLTDSDLKSIKDFLEEPSQGGEFFTSAELDEFIKNNVH